MKTFAPSSVRAPARRRPAQNESALWRSVPGEWRRLYGGFHDLGASLEWHNLQPAGDFEWSRSFQPGSVELCLNLSGRGVVRHAGASAGFEPLTAGFYLTGESSLQARRHAGEAHQFITAAFSPRFLARHLNQCDGALHPLVERCARGEDRLAGVSEVRRLTTEQRQLIGRLIDPPVFQGARPLWYQSKVLELMSEFFFERRSGDELFCDRQKRVARERVDRVIALLRERLAEPPGLDEIACHTGCSPFYLSRIFSREMGMTIPQFLRQIRIERAAELLRAGTHNVTEAALEVGYSSISHFSQAFCQTIGCCPNLYPHARALLKNPSVARPPAASS